MRISRRVRAAIGIIALSALAACSGTESPPAAGGDKAAGPEKTEITVGVLPVPDNSAVFIAQQRGFFKEEGLSVKTEIIQGGAAAIPSLLSGTLDVSMTNYVSAFIAAGRGNKIKIITDLYQAGPDVFNIIAAKDSAISSVADLKGKKIAVNTLNNIGTLAVTATLKAGGLTAEDVQFVELPLPNMSGALQKGQIDAAWTTEPFLTGAAKDIGARKIADTMTGPLAGFPIAGLSATSDFTEKYPKTLAAFQRAVAKAQQIVAADRKAVEEVLPTYTKIDAATAAAIRLGTFPTGLDPQRLQRVADVMLEQKYLETAIDAKTIVAGSGG
ncbi:ABC transporter substrate-binding protein [Planomonospora sp. ID67723]|uniref:ABC transporter substrate-binding protein n=1 Tax=Planomonospora sp. ID67723 TaxID=2738134 RepID=UPI0018C37AF4|nr:ABC transporter substrate-binding protein [Planomonospora sp. ID67723]MBG0828467.1 ABC transporter substrate-binding protein [Planomonospora sp. ID67723]